MFNIDLQSRIPVWEQIVKMIEKYIQLGILSPGDKLPSVRELTQQIGINPNTVQKAMNDLSMRGIIISVSGRGSFVSRDARAVLLEKAEKRLPELSSLISELLVSGVSVDEIKKTVQEAVEKTEE